MNAEAPISIDAAPSLRQRLGGAVRARLVPLAEIATAIAVVAIATVSYFIVSKESRPGALLSPPLVATLLVANLVPAMALMVLVARRFAMRRAASSLIGGRGRLHVRLVALFSVIASVPTLLVVIFASLLFQIGADFWSSERARAMLENTATIAQEAYQQELTRVELETVTMSKDLIEFLSERGLDDPQFAEFFFNQVYVRNLSEAVIMSVGPDGEIRRLALVNPYDRTLEREVTSNSLKLLSKGRVSVTTVTGDRIGSVTPLPVEKDTYLYAARAFDPEMTARLQRAEAVLADYNALLAR